MRLLTRSRPTFRGTSGQADAAELERALQHLALNDETAAIQRFRQIAQHLEEPAHRKHYLGPTGMIAVAAVEAGADLVVEDAAARALFGSRRDRGSILARLGF